MRRFVFLAAILVLAGVGYLFFGTSNAREAHRANPNQEPREASGRIGSDPEVPDPKIERTHAARTARDGGANAPGAIVKWREDSQFIEAVAQTVAEIHPDRRQFSIEDAATSQLGSRHLEVVMKGEAGTFAGFRVEAEDFVGLAEHEKLSVAYALATALRRGEHYGYELSKDLPPEKRQALLKQMRSESLYYPPEMLVESLDVNENWRQRTEAIAKVRDLRAQMLVLIAPIAADLRYLKRTTRKASMMHGLPIPEFDPEKDASLVAPDARELEADIQAVCEEFYGQLGALLKEE